MIDRTNAPHDERDAVLTRLRARVAELEAQLEEQAARTNAAVARAEQRVYWLDRWHVDLNAAMERPAAGRIRGLLRLLRRPVRLLHKARRALR